MVINYMLAVLVGAFIGYMAAWVYMLSASKAVSEKAYQDGYRDAESRRRKPYKLIVAGNYGQFRNWVQSHIIHGYANQHLVGRDWDQTEIIKVGDWQASPVLDLLREYMSKEEWERFLSEPIY